MALPYLLVIDDEVILLDIISEVARDVGFVTATCSSAADFLEKFRLLAPSVVLIDLKLPDMDGIELLRALSTMDCRAKVLLMSGVGERVLEAATSVGRDRGLDMGPPIAKPTSVDELERLLKSLLPAATKITVESLENAITNGELVLHYQPKIDLATRRLSGCEALVRWEHPILGLVAPGSFIPLAEGCDLIHALTRWVFRAAIAQASDWKQAGTLIPLSINISAKNLATIDLPDWMQHVCREFDIATDDITIELTETATMNDTVLLLDVLTRFRLKGFQLSIDDFGTGYSSLGQLRSLPFSEIKVDQLFVRTMIESKDSFVIVHTIIDMAHNLGLLAVAEGVETQDILDRLIELGCDSAQGYFIGRPMGPDLILPMFRSSGGQAGSGAAAAN